MKKVLLTGISGLLGINLANELLTGGYYVKGLIRNISNFKGILHQNLELIECDLFDDLTPFCQGCDYIIHSAAETRQNLTRYAEYREINCNATIQLFNTGLKCKVSRFVFISTSNTLGYGSLEDPGSEIKEIRYPFSELFYAKSKLEAENYLLKNQSQSDVVIIYPGFMLGAFDTKPSSGKIILMGWKKKFLFYPPGGKSFVHVKDVAKAIVSSLENAGNGEKYLVVNENLSYADFFRKLNRVTNQNPVMFKIPGMVLIGLGYLGDLIRFFNIRTNISSVNMRALCTKNFYSNKKSISELRIQYNPIESAIEDAVGYFRDKYPQ